MGPGGRSCSTVVAAFSRSGWLRVLDSSITSLHGGKQQVVHRQALVERVGVVGAKVGHVAILHDGDLVALGQQLQLVGDPHHRLVAQHAADAMLEDVDGGVLVHGRQGVVQQHQLRVVVGGARQAHALALATGQVDAALTSHGLVTVRQDLQIQLQRAGMDDLLVLDLIKGQAKQDVLPQAQVLHPGGLGHVGHGPAHSHATLLQNHVLQDGLEHGRLAAANAAHDGHHLSGLDAELGDVQLELVSLLLGVHQLGIVKLDFGLLG
mmetsp:Transcript_13475/g.33014  ORF Transcript_13475/g.33014 Transcript_13475/m.33014 type:complete len:265 (-) Transcript_13475:1342-2136(-)